MLANPEQELLDNVQRYVAGSILESLFGSDVPVPVIPPDVLFDGENQNKKFLVHEELKFKVGMRKLWRATAGEDDGGVDRSSIGGNYRNGGFQQQNHLIDIYWAMLRSGILAQDRLPARPEKGVTEPDAVRELRKTGNSVFRAFAAEMAKQRLLGPRLSGQKLKLALWSGGIEASNYASNLGNTCLESSAIGGLFDFIQIYQYDKHLWYLWDYLSEEFVNQLQKSGGVVHVFVRTFDNTATLFETEYPALLKILRTHPGVTIDFKWHVLITLKSASHPNEFSVRDGKGNPVIMRELSHFINRPIELTKRPSPFAFPDPVTAYNAQRKFLETNKADPLLDPTSLKITLETAPFTPPV